METMAMHLGHHSYPPEHPYLHALGWVLATAPLVVPLGFVVYDEFKTYGWKKVLKQQLGVLVGIGIVVTVFFGIWLINL